MEGGTGTRSRAGLRRREFLIGGAGAGLVLAGPVNYAAIARGLRAPVAKHGKFAHGVAAGFPSPKGVTLWTRVSELDRSSKLTLEVAKDKQLQPAREEQGGPRRGRAATSPSTSTSAG